MAIMKYEDMLTRGNEEINKAKAPLRAREMRKKAELEVCKLESMLADREQMINNLSSEYPVNFSELLDAIDDFDLTKRRKDQFEAIINAMFAEE